jgi:glycerophosphoryl diester phosphodiesterase
MAVSELRKLDAGILCAPEFSGERMALLSEAMEYCKQHAIRMNIEIKPALGQDEQTGRAVARAVQEAYLGHEGTLPLLSSFSVASLAAAAGEAPDLSRALLLESLPRDWKSLAESLGAIAIHPDAALATERFVGEVLDAGYQMMVYTVDDHRVGQDLLELGVDAICTNRPDLFL